MSANFCVWLLCLVLLTSAEAQTQVGPRLSISISGQNLSFHLDDAGPDDPWVLQYFAGAEGWQDLIFLDGGIGPIGLGAQFARGVLQGRAFENALFRARRRNEDDPAYRDFLQARMRWRAADLSFYSYTIVSQSQLGPIEKTYTVKNGEIVGGLFPIDLGALGLAMTIEEWFDEIATAFEAGAPVIDVDWNVETGHPERAYLDLDAQIADEERSWTITELTALGEKGPDYQEFLAAREGWETRGPSDYRYTMEYFAGLAFEEVRFTVRDGVVVEAEKLAGSSSSEDPIEMMPPDATMDYWMTEIEEAFENEVVVVGVTWDGEPHFPKSAYFDNHPDFFDSGRGWTIKEMIPLEAGP